MRGRKPKPTIIKDLHGSRKPRNPDEPTTSVTLDDVGAPDHFDEEHRKVWSEALASAPAGMVKAIDGAVLEVWVSALVLYRRAQKGLSNFGRGALVIPAPQSRYPIQNPYVGIMNSQAKVLMRAASELGFSPTSRTRVSATSGPDLGPRQAAAAAGADLDSYLGSAPAARSLH